MSAMVFLALVARRTAIGSQGRIGQDCGRGCAHGTCYRLRGAALVGASLATGHGKGGSG